MPLNIGLDRRAFLKSAGMTALAGAVGPGTAAAATPVGISIRKVMDTTDDPGFEQFGEPAVNDSGAVAFWARSGSGPEDHYARINLAMGATVQTVADTSGIFQGFEAFHQQC